MVPHRKENATDFHFTENHANCNTEILAIIPYPATKHKPHPNNKSA